MLKNEQNRTRVAVAKMLKMYPGYSKRAFDGLVTYDETWVYWCSNRVWATRNGRCHIIPKQPRTFKTIMQVIFYCNSKVLSKRCIKKIKKNLPNPPPHNRLNHLRLLHDNTPAHKVRIVTEFFFNQRTSRLPHPLTPQTLPLAIISCFQNQYIIYLEADIIL